MAINKPPRRDFVTCAGCCGAAVGADSLSLPSVPYQKRRSWPCPCPRLARPLLRSPPLSSSQDLPQDLLARGGEGGEKLGVTEGVGEREGIGGRGREQRLRVNLRQLRTRQCRAHVHVFNAAVAPARTCARASPLIEPTHASAHTVALFLRASLYLIHYISMLDDRSCTLFCILCILYHILLFIPCLFFDYILRILCKVIYIFVRIILHTFL